VAAPYSQNYDGEVTRGSREVPRLCRVFPCTTRNTSGSLAPTETDAADPVLLRGTQNAAHSAPKRPQVNIFSDIVGVSESLLEALELVRTVAPTDSTVLIEGETGTSKELVAQAIHNLQEMNRAPLWEMP